jgi:Ca2+-binding EF-hand superfamily protein
MNSVRGIDKDKIKKILTAAFSQADGDGSGALDRDQLKEVLQRLGASQLALSDHEVTAIMSGGDRRIFIFESS